MIFAASRPAEVVIPELLSLFHARNCGANPDLTPCQRLGLKADFREGSLFRSYLGTPQHVWQNMSYMKASYCGR